MKQAKILKEDVAGMTFLDLEEYLFDQFGFDRNKVGVWTRTATHYFFMQEENKR